MASIKTISLPHGTIPTQMFGNVNLQNAVMYINENFAEVKSGVNDAISATNDALNEKAASDHDHDAAYAALEHTHGMDSVTGLSAALDGKAELNHEHSQYLSSLPAHYHDTTQIGGLDAALNGKAEIVHTHAMAQIDGLSTELGVKASTAYVDQQIAQLGSTVKQTMLNAMDTDPTATTGISITPDYQDSSGSSATKQQYLNMTDWAPPKKMVGDDTNHTPVGWERGKTAWKNGVPVDDTHPAVGCSIKVCSHSIIRSVTTGGVYTTRVELFFTKLDFDENGLLVRAVPASDWYTLPMTPA